MIACALPLLGQLGSQFGGLDWGIVTVFLLVSTLVAFAKKGRQAGVRDYFLANRDLPWVAVCASLVATEISGASFIGVPYDSFNGSFTYLQLAIGAILARVLIGYYLIPHFYAGEFYSPYQVVGQRLGLGAERVTRGLFMVGAVLGQGVRVFVTAAVLQLITGVPVQWSIVVICVVAALWAAIGGIRTVVWTDVLQLGAIVVSAVVVFFYLGRITTGGWSEILQTASAATDLGAWGKFTFFDLRFDLALDFTIWTGLLGSTFNTLASHGADQMNAQRLFCCRSVNEARKAILWSSLTQVFVLLLAFIGLGLYAYYRQHPDTLQELTYGVPRSRVFAIFIATALPVGVKGLLAIGLLGAAISSLDSALAALAQTTTRSIFTTNGHPDLERVQVQRARLLTLAWGVVLALTALYFQSVVIDVVIGSALKTTSFTYGALVGSLLLAVVPHQRDGRGVLFGAPLAVLAAYGVATEDSASHWIVGCGLVLILGAWSYVLFKEVDELAGISDHQQYVRRAWYLLLAEFPRTIWVLVGLALVLFAHLEYGFGGTWEIASHELAWPWYLPMGTGVTVLFGLLLSRPKAAR